MQQVRPRAKKLLLERLGGARGVYFARQDDYERIDFLKDTERRALCNKSIDCARRIITNCADRDISIITLKDAAYPLRLAEIYAPPLVLYVRGKLPAIDESCAVAVVGTRDASPYGLKMAQQMGHGIAECGGVVISGMTRGIDAAAARGALLAGGKCIGVLGTAIDEEFPSESTAYSVLLYGAVVSEYPPGARPGAHAFRERNRITSGLSVATLVIEAPARSGALLFADEALEQGREVYVVPGNADEPHAEGSNRLMMEGAHPVLRAWDLMSEFAGRFPDVHEPGRGSKLNEELVQEGVELESKKSDKAEDKHSGDDEKPKPESKLSRWKKKRREKNEDAKKDVDKPEAEEYIDLQKQLEGLSEPQLKIVSAITAPHTHVDDIIERCGLPAAQVLGELTLLRIKGCIIDEPGKRFSLNITQK